jgi:hypothetical protein
MTSINASYQTGLQLMLMAASSASNSGTGASDGSGTSTSVNVGTTAAGTATQNNSTSSDSLDSYSASSSISSLKFAASAASGPAAGAMAAIVAALSSKNGFYENDAAAANAAFQANSNLSSQQLSDTLLSGGSIVGGLNADGSSFETESLASILSSVKNAIVSGAQGDEELSQWVQGGMSSSEHTYGKSAMAALSTDQINNIISSNEQSIAEMKNTVSGVEAALAKGTLKIQKATDVVGLNFSDEVVKRVAVQGGENSIKIKDESYNINYENEHKGNGFLTSINNIGVYLSW